MNKNTEKIKDKNKILIHRSIRAPKEKWEERNPSTVPLTSAIALREAIRIEGVSETEYDDYLWIMAQESGGVVGISNLKSTARGLFQLLRALYHLNPNGDKSFGNAVEECQGGVRYIVGRYHSAANARKHWEKYHWY
jgi:hypothetical protein